MGKWSIAVSEKDGIMRTLCMQDGEYMLTNRTEIYTPLEFGRARDVLTEARKFLLRFSVPRGWKLFLVSPSGALETIETIKKKLAPTKKEERRKIKFIQKRHNPLYSEEKKEKGKDRAEARKAYLEKNEYRMQATPYLKNMIKALEIHPWLNTIDDWQRYHEAKMIIKIRSSKRKNPGLSETEIRVLRSLHLKGCMGKCGNLTAGQRKKLLDKLVSEGYLDKKGNITLKGVNASAPLAKK